VIKTSDQFQKKNGRDVELDLRILGSFGPSDLIPLDDSITHRRPFRRGQIDIFEIELPDLGAIESVQITGINPSDLGSNVNVISNLDNHV
jgi:hypothetical protein